MTETERVQALRIESLRSDLDGMRKMFDLTRHRVLERLGEQDLGKSWSWVESRCGELAKEGEYMKAKRDYLLNEVKHLNEADERWVEGNCGTCPTIEKLIRARDAAQAGLEETMRFISDALMYDAPTKKTKKLLETALEVAVKAGKS